MEGAHLQLSLFLSMTWNNMRPASVFFENCQVPPLKNRFQWENTLKGGHYKMPQQHGFQ